MWPGMPFPNLDGRIHQSLVFVTFLVLAKKIRAKPIINKYRLIFRHALLHFASVQQEFSESVNQPMQRLHTKGSYLYAHVESGASGTCLFGL